MTSETDSMLWFVAHTLPRCEKKVVRSCEREHVSHVLPTYRAVHKYRRKTVAFDKPLFPGYVFLRMLNAQRSKVANSDYVANLLNVTDQALFSEQLEEILTALDTELEIRLAPAIGPGMRVKIKHGPLQGLDGWVEQRYGMSTVLLRLDFIGQAAAIKVEADNLEFTS
jgi:transcription antitermination factor NusG